MHNTMEISSYFSLLLLHQDLYDTFILKEMITYAQHYHVSDQYKSFGMYRTGLLDMWTYTLLKSVFSSSISLEGMRATGRIVWLSITLNKKLTDVSSEKQTDMSFFTY